MRIAIIVMELNVSGGTQRQALELAIGLQNKGHKVVVYGNVVDRKLCYPHLIEKLDVRSPQGLNKIQSRKIPLLGRNVNKTLNEAYWPFRSQDSSVKRLTSLVKQENFDIINPHDPPANEVASKYKSTHPEAKAVWMSNDMPWIFQVVEQHGLPGKRQRIKSPFWSYLMRNAATRASREIKKLDTIVVLDKRNKDLYRKHLGITPIVVRSGIDNLVFKPKFKKNNKNFMILATGILFPHRRFEDLIEAINIVKKTGKKMELNIIGSKGLAPNYANELTLLTKKLKLEKEVNFLGRVEESELLKKYRQADVFVFPNHNQTWGLAVFEALASGTPVVVSRTSGAHEVLTDGENALLVDPKNPHQIAEKLIKLYDNPELREKIARNGQLFVKRNLSWKNYTNNMEKIFKEVRVYK